MKELFFLIIVFLILIVLTIKTRKRYIMKQINSDRYFIKNKFINDVLDAFISSQKGHKNTISIENLEFTECTRHDIINYRTVLSEIESMDRNIITSVYISTIILGFSWMIRDKMNLLSMSIAIIIVLLLASMSVYLIADTFDSTWLGGKKYLIDLYLQKHYPND